MKFSTLFAAALLFCSVSHVSAQNSQSQGELKFDNVIMKGYSQIATPMAVTSEGNVVVTSTMINGQSLGSFVAMSSPKLPNSPTWKVDIKSGSIINAILADNEGGVYIGGDFNEKITLGGITLTGKKSENAEKTNAFVAHISKEGKVLAAYAFVSTPNAEMVEKFDNTQSDPESTIRHKSAVTKVITHFLFLKAGNQLSQTTKNNSHAEHRSPAYQAKIV